MCALFFLLVPQQHIVLTGAFPMFTVDTSLTFLSTRSQSTIKEIRTIVGGWWRREMPNILPMESHYRSCRRAKKLLQDKKVSLNYSEHKRLPNPKLKNCVFHYVIWICPKIYWDRPLPILYFAKQGENKFCSTDSTCERISRQTELPLWLRRFLKSYLSII